MDDANAWAPAPRHHLLALAFLLSATGCASYIGTTAASFMGKVRESPDPNIRHLAYGKLAETNCYDNDEQRIESAKLLAEKLQKGNEPLASRALICRTLGELRRPEARPALIAAVDDPEAMVRSEACTALGKIGVVEDAPLLTRIMTADTSRDCRIAAIEALGTMEPDDPRVDVLLVDGMAHNDPAVRYACLQTLRSIYDKDLGVELEPWKKVVEAKIAASTKKDPIDDATMRASASASPAPATSAQGAPATAPGTGPNAKSASRVVSPGAPMRQ